MKHIVLLALFGVAGIASGQTPPVQPQTPDIKIPPRVLMPGETIEAGKQPLSVAEAVSIALKNQPQIGIAQGNLESAQGRTQQARSNLLPQFGVSTTYSQSSPIFGGSSSASGSNRFSSALSVDQLLFDFGRTRDSVRSQTALERAAQFTVTQTQQSVVSAVKTAYYDFQQNQQFRQIAEDNLTNTKRQLDEAQARLDSGLGAPGDVVQAKTNLASSVLALEAARATESNSRVILAQQLGINPLTPIVTTDTTGEQPLQDESSLELLVQAAMTDRPDIKAATERVNAARFAVGVAGKGDLPRISATAGVGSRGETSPFQSNTGTFGITLSWNFADSGFTAGAVRSAKGDQLAAQNNLLAISQSAVTEISQTWMILQTAKQRIETAQDQVANAQEYVRIAEGRYSGGLGQFLDVVSAQNSLVSAQRNLAQAQQDVSRARAQLLAAVGRQ